MCGGNRAKEYTREEVIKRQYLLKYNDVSRVFILCAINNTEKFPNLFAFKYLLVRNVLRLCTTVTFSYIY